MVGLKEAEGFITVVGSRIGNAIDNEYKTAMRVNALPRDVVSSVLVDLKRRVGSDFEVEYEDDEKIVLRNSRCPFGEKVKGRPSLCMMTTNVFGRITANNTGYAKVHIEQAIATGASGCRVVVYLSETAAGTEGGVEFFRTA